VLDLRVTIDGNKVVIDGLRRFEKSLPAAIQAGLDRSGKGIFSEAFLLVSGAGAKGRTGEVMGRTGSTYLKWQPQSIPPGGYPVPVRKGNLRDHLNLLLHGQTKSDKYGSYSAGKFENIIYDSAPYSVVIHEGLGTSAKFGPRRYTTDALEKFNQGDRIKRNLEEEIRKARGK
jgi:hypothetical protein